MFRCLCGSHIQHVCRWFVCRRPDAQLSDSAWLNLIVCLWCWSVCVHIVDQPPLCVCKNTPRLTYLLQNARSRISLSSIWRRQKDGESSHGEKARKQIKRRNCQAVCSHLSPTWKSEKTKPGRRLGRLEKGNKKQGRRGRGGEEEEESRFARSPKRHVGVWSWSAGTSSSIDFIENQSPGKRLEWKETFHTGSAGRKGSLIRRIRQHGDTHPAGYISGIRICKQGGSYFSPKNLLE